MSAFVMSDEYPKLCKAIENFGYDIIPSDKILQFNTPEQRHIDYLNAVFLAVIFD